VDRDAAWFFTDWDFGNLVADIVALRVLDLDD
jgi:hypothetical protein